MYAFIYVCIDVCMHACACMYARTHVRMHSCLLAYIYCIYDYITVIYHSDTVHENIWVSWLTMSGSVHQCATLRLVTIKNPVTLWTISMPD